MLLPGWNEAGPKVQPLLSGIVEAGAVCRWAGLSAQVPTWALHAFSQMCTQSDKQK